MTRSLSDWLEHCERLHPVGIDLGLDRVQAVRERMGLNFSMPVITVAGTNGKGSTCAIMESVLMQAGYRVGVYSSPHLVNFEERLRLNGRAVDAALLPSHFESVEVARGGVSLTYFEFTTLALMHALSCQALDVVILEVGLGGRLDAVNVIDPDCAVITSIDLDHMDYLGPDRESIGREKAGIMRAGRPAIVSDPVPPASVVSHAEALGVDLWLQGRDFNFSGDRQQWSWAGRGRRYHALAYPALRGANQLLNASGAFAALEALRPRLPVTAQDIRVGLASVQLPGRFQIVPGQPALVLDVGHNPHASAVLAQNLDQMGYYPRTAAVFGAMADKDLAGLVGPLLPLVERWYCCELPTPRAAHPQELVALLESEFERRKGSPAVPPGARAQACASPHSALALALAEMDPADRIIVFGSFYTVGDVMQQGLPRLGASHVQPGSAGDGSVRVLPG